MVTSRGRHGVEVGAAAVLEDYGLGTGLERGEGVIAVVIGGCTPPAGERPAVATERPLLLNDRPGFVELPELEQRVRHRLPGAVGDPAVQPDGPRMTPPTS